jgi:hypothetical protein
LREFCAGATRCAAYQDTQIFYFKSSQLLKVKSKIYSLLNLLSFELYNTQEQRQRQRQRQRQKVTALLKRACASANAPALAAVQLWRKSRRRFSANACGCKVRHTNTRYFSNSAPLVKHLKKAGKSCTFSESDKRLDCQIQINFI